MHRDLLVICFIKLETCDPETEELTLPESFVKSMKLSLLLYVRYCFYLPIYLDQEPRTIQSTLAKFLGPCLIMDLPYLIRFEHGYGYKK